jgi:hypothetical protein
MHAVRTHITIAPEHAMAAHAGTHAARPETAHALEAALRARGVVTDGFRLEEEAHPEIADALGVNGGFLKLRCRSTGEERLYSTGAGSGGLGAFLMDLGRGHFREAARHPGPTPLTTTAPVPSILAW